VELEHPEPGLRQRVVDALNGKNARLLKITPSYSGSGSAQGGLVIGKGLHDLTPEEVFGQRYESVCGNAPPDEILEAFHELLQQVELGEAPL
jgi:DNA repair protein SbcD/Mre11